MKKRVFFGVMGLMTIFLNGVRADTECYSDSQTMQTMTGTLSYDSGAFYRTGTAYGFTDEKGIFWKVYALGPLVASGIEAGMAPFLDKKVRLTACFSNEFMPPETGVVEKLTAAEFV